MFFVRLKLKACKRNSNCILPISLKPNVAILNLAEFKHSPFGCKDIDKKNLDS